jgi:hypothetical protein
MEPVMPYIAFPSLFTVIYGLQHRDTPALAYRQYRLDYAPDTPKYAHNNEYIRVLVVYRTPGAHLFQCCLIGRTSGRPREIPVCGSCLSPPDQ